MDSNIFECSRYLREISKFGLLTKEEVSLAKQIRQGDMEARKELINHNLRLVPGIAKKYMNLGIDYSDLIQAGNEGIFKAVDSFDPDRGLKFSTIATFCITNSIIDFVNKNSRSVRIPAHKLSDVKKLQEAASKYISKYGFEPSYDYLSAATSIKKSKVIELLNVTKETVNLDAEIGEDYAYIDKISDKGPENRETIKYEALKNIVKKYSKSLDNESRRIIELRFGLNGDLEMKQSKVSDITGIPVSRVKKIEGEFIKKVQATEDFQKLGLVA